VARGPRSRNLGRSSAGRAAAIRSTAARAWVGPPDLGEQVVRAGRARDPRRLLAAAEAGQGEGLVLDRAVGPGQPEQGLGGGWVEAAGQLGVAQLDPPAVAEGALQLAAGPLQHGGGLAPIAGDQGALGQGQLGVQAGMGAGGVRAEQVQGTGGQVAGAGQGGREAGGEHGPEQPGGPAGLDAAVEQPARLGEPVAVLQQEAQVGDGGGLGGGVGVGEGGVEGRPGPGQVALGVAHAGGQQQRRRAGPGAATARSASSRACGVSSEAAWWSRP
jgi:hypothetical protein